MDELLRTHHERLEGALEACATRRAWTAFPEGPLRDPEALVEAERTLWARRGTVLDEAGEPSHVVVGEEVSPYSGARLGVAYPGTDVDILYARAQSAMAGWRDAGPERRVGACLEMVERLYRRGPEITVAIQHTTGQSPGLAATGSGTDALDRGLEALAHAHAAMARVTPAGRWEQDFGGTTVRVDKRYRLVPRGVGVVICPGSFPSWTSYPAIFASLATGNPVIVKPSPSSVLPMALAVGTLRGVLSDLGFSPDVVQLAPDTAESPITGELVSHPACAIVDFTGSPLYGRWLERNCHPALVFSKTAGVNAVLLDSVEDLGPAMAALATAMSLFSGQMCTTPQNLYLPVTGVRTPEGHVGYDDVVAALVEAVDAIADTPHRAAAVLGAVQSEATLRLVERMSDAAAHRGRVLRKAIGYAHPRYPDARTLSPLIAEVGPDARDLHGLEQFGPVAFVLPVADRDEALERATHDARERGAIASYLLSTDGPFIDRAEESFALAGASLSSNLVGPMPMQFAAAYSDYHVTGLNPAGNASLTDEAYVQGRFRIVQARRGAA